MFPDLIDGKCRSCGRQLNITGADDVSLHVECMKCDDAYCVETDAFIDGRIKYRPEIMADQELGEES